ncbi:MAG TPA: glycosyltransferase, partial [Candidatus Dormibacteraeota bacterium]|nr:glycosyltransferase [Candidatus Dormibacteraeota bacterium]
MFLVALLTLSGLSVAGSVIYLLMLALASFRTPADQVAKAPTAALKVLVPAHDEAELIMRSVRSLQEQDYPADLVEVVVIADNCTDFTAALAEAAGARVLVRSDLENQGKGAALRWAMDSLLASDPDLDAFVVVDADSIVKPGFLAALASELEAGHEVAQSDYAVLDGGEGGRSALTAAGFMLFHKVRPAGRMALGMPTALVGNGMLFSKGAITNCPWNAYSGVEDLEYTVSLRLAGIRPVFAHRALVLGPMPASRKGAATQRMRWEGGRFHVIRHRLPELIGAIVTQRRLDLVDMAVDLAVLPLGILAMTTIGGLVVSSILIFAHLAPLWAVMPWLAAAVALPAYVLVGLRAAGASSAAYLALLGVPWFLARKVLVYGHLVRGFDAGKFERAERPSEERSDPEGRVQVAGVEIDSVDMETALARTSAALDGDKFTQICTVNLDFLVQAQRDPEIRLIFSESQLNVADGAPVLWLGRMLGRALPERVAGADMVPAMVALAAGQGRGVFLLGGQDGVAEAAARVLRDRHPG